MDCVAGHGPSVKWSAGKFLVPFKAAHTSVYDRGKLGRDGLFEIRRVQHDMTVRLRLLEKGALCHFQSFGPNSVKSDKIFPFRHTWL